MPYSTDMTKTGRPLLRGKHPKFDWPEIYIMGVEVNQSSNIPELRELLTKVKALPEYPDQAESITILEDILKGWDKWAYIN